MSDKALPFRVLVVDDDPDMAAYLALILRKEGLVAEEAHDGEAALVRVHTDAPDLVLCDVMMPGMSGFEVCQRLKNDESTALIPVVLITALEDQPSRVKGIEAGADDFLSKPVKREELLARVRTLRRLHETRKELEQRRLTVEIQRKESIRKAFSRYISPRLAERIIDDSMDSGGEPQFMLRPQRSSLVAMFADLRGFTRLTERLEVGRVVEMLNQYFTILTEAAYNHEATIFNMAGDSLLVGFNVPFPQKDAAIRAYKCANEMITRFNPVAEQWLRDYGLQTGVGIGACTGEAIIGNVGSPHYMNYTIIGDPVNTAARLMQMAPPNELLVCQAIYDAIKHLVAEGCAESRGDVSLKGKSAAIPVYALKITVPEAA
jgi:class 3 adenylate cyclase